MQIPPKRKMDTTKMAAAMPKRIPPLSGIQVKNAKPKDSDYKLVDGYGRYVFPCHRSPLRPMTNNAINAALRRMGYTSDEITAPLIRGGPFIPVAHFRRKAENICNRFHRKRGTYNVRG